MIMYSAGDWVLLDEINLATAETLECLSGLLESHEGSLFLLERGDREPIMRHPDFRLFAAMNPATDVGKKQLPTGLRSRFTEFVVDEINSPHDLATLIGDYLRELNLTAVQVTVLLRIVGTEVIFLNVFFYRLKALYAFTLKSVGRHSVVLPMELAVSRTSASEHCVVL
jgi:hypothetical protein